jgi:outer membrane receptor for ferrienterochelin and colicin
MGRLAVAVLLLLSPACGRRTPTSGAAGAARDIPPQAGTLITQERIAASGAKTAWDAVRLTVPNLQLRESRGRATRIQRRGRASIYLDDQVRVILDHVRLEDVQVLQQIAATDILTIQVLSGLDATTYYGGSSMSGVIVITTTRGS